MAGIEKQVEILRARYFVKFIHANIISPGRESMIHIPIDYKFIDFSSSRKPTLIELQGSFFNHNTLGADPSITHSF